MKTLLLLLLLLAVAAAAPAQNLTIRVDEGIELMSVLQYLSGHLGNETGSPYKTDIKRYFGPYRCHPAVTWFFNANWPVYPDLVECGLVFDHFPDIRMRRLPDSCSWFKFVNRDTLDTFLHMAMQFYQDTHFHEFYTAHAADYAAWEQGLRDSIGEPIRVFDSLINTRRDHHWLICMEVLDDWGAHTIEPNNINPAYRNYFIYQLPYFGDTDRMGRMTFNTDLYNFAWHEGTHAFTDSLLRLNAASIDSLAYLFHESAPLARQNIHDWAHYVNELIPRAVSIALHRQFRSPAAYQALLAWETRNGFVQVGAVADLIYANFIHQRKVDSFGALLPEILAVLRANRP